MPDKKYLLGSVVNLATLCIGLVLGFAFGATRTAVVRAQVNPPPPTPQVEEVTPNVTSGSAAFGTLLASRIAADEIAVRGFDPIKFDENLLNLLGTKVFFTRQELQTLVDKSKAEKILRMKLQSPPVNPPAEKKP